MGSIAFERRQPGESEVCSPILAYSIGNSGKMGSKTKKQTIAKKKNSTYFSSPCRSPKGHHGDVRINATVRDYKNIVLEGSFDLLELSQPELYKIDEKKRRCTLLHARCCWG